MTQSTGRLAEILGDIKIQHTIFALPFALMSAFMAADGWPGWRLFLLIVVSMAFARSAAMAFNRLVDAKFDSDNPRTKTRSLAANRGKSGDYILFITICSVGFIATCWLINQLAFYLSIPALAIVFFYSFTKRFTPYSHFFLGFALALAPIGAWVAVREEFSLVAATLGAAVVFWLAGLDTIYSCQDVEYDSELKLNSIPQRFGVGLALKMAGVFHVFMVALLVAVALIANLSWLYFAGVAFTAAMLFYEHSLVSEKDLKKVNIAFFNVNGIVSMGLMAFTILDVLIIS